MGNGTILVILVVAFTLCPGCAGEPLVKAKPRETWSARDGGPARMNYAADAHLDKQPDLIWTREVLKVPRHFISMALAEENVLCLVCGAREKAPTPMRREKVYAVGLDLADGREIWRYDPPDAWGYGKQGLDEHLAALANGEIFLPAETGLMVIDSRTGRLLRHFREDWSIIRKPGFKATFRFPEDIVVDGEGSRAYLAGWEGGVRCMSLTDGRILWENPLFGTADADGFEMDVALQDGKIAAMGARNVACAAVLSAEDGKTLWKSATLPWRGLIGPVAPWPPMLVGNYVVMSARQGVGFEILESYVMALDASSGKVTWTTGLRKALPMSVASDGIRLWALGRERELVCMDLRSGSRIWESKEVQDAEAGPVLSGEVLLVLDKDVLRGFCAADGRVLWTIALDKQLDARRLLVCNGYVVLTGPTHIAVFKAK